MKLLSLQLPGDVTVNAPAGILRDGEVKLVDILQAFINLFFIFAIIFALFVIIYSGWLWMTSVGDKQKIGAAKQRLTYALVGLIVVLLSFFIVNFVTSFLGVNILNTIPKIPTI